jgi:DNA-binding transcriptional LysR family regulator
MTISIIAARCNEWILDAAPAQPKDSIGDWPGPRRDIERTRALTRQNFLLVRIMRPLLCGYTSVNSRHLVRFRGLLQHSSGYLDLALIKRDAGDGAGIFVRRDRLCWSAVAGLRFDPDRRLPLVIYKQPSLTRNRAVAALEAMNRPFRVTCTVQGVNGLLAAVRAGLGVAVFAGSLMPDDLVELPSSAGLPDLSEVDHVLLKSPRAAAQRVDALTQAILRSGPPIAARGRPSVRAIR